MKTLDKIAFLIMSDPSLDLEIKYRLRDNGFEVFTFTSWTSATGYIKLGPHVIILDLEIEGNPIISKSIFQAGPVVIDKHQLKEALGEHCKDQIATAVIERIKKRKGAMSILHHLLVKIKVLKSQGKIVKHFLYALLVQVLISLPAFVLHAQDPFSHEESKLLGPWKVEKYKMQTGLKSVTNFRAIQFEFFKDRSVKVLSLPNKELIAVGNYSLKEKNILVGTEPSVYREDVFIIFDFSVAQLGIDPGDELSLDVTPSRLLLEFQEGKVRHAIKLRQNFR